MEKTKEEKNRKREEKRKEMRARETTNILSGAELNQAILISQSLRKRPY